MPSPDFSLATTAADWERYDPFAKSAGMRAVKRALDRVASTDATVLISGESGVGKELVARALHKASSRHGQAFIRMSCSALPLDLLDAEFFGYERGAPTGEYRRKPGKFELASGGTIFLDKVGELPGPLQGKLLHVLQDHEFSCLDGREEVRVDARLIAATNKDLAALVDRGVFLEDLYYKLNAVNIYVPPLRDRREDIPVLVDLLIGRYARQYMRPRHILSAPAAELLQVYAWPGNVRQLENIVRRIVLLGTEDWLGQELRVTQPIQAASPLQVKTVRLRSMASALPDEGPSLKAIARAAALEAEREALAQALNSVRWNRRAAARQLKVSYRTLRRKIEQCGLED